MTQLVGSCWNFSLRGQKQGKARVVRIILGGKGL